MNKIINPMSIRDNGKQRPLSKEPFNINTLNFEDFVKYWGDEVSKHWTYRDQVYEVDFNKQGLTIVELLPDETGFFAMKQRWHQPEAYILNGDISVRHVIKPLFNVNELNAQRIELLRQLEEKMYPPDVYPERKWNPRAYFHENTSRGDCLEVAGFDGFIDCLYRYNTDTGEVISFQTLGRAY